MSVDRVDEELTKECLQALYGADYLREKLMVALSLGPHAIAKSYYALKCRVKSQNSLYDKVRRKREQENKPNYKAIDATDIVGLRILTIHSSELFRATRDFIDFVSFCQRREVHLFRGGQLSDTIREIIIYRSDNNAAAYELVYSSLRTLAPFRSGSLAVPKLEYVKADDRQPYSSIHLVCECISHHAQGLIRIPLEVQIRTVFEDAWNEVDHPLRYKRNTNHGQDANAIQENLKQYVNDSLLTLKQQLEASGRAADNIRDLHFQIEDLLSSKSPQHYFSEPSVSHYPIARHFNFSNEHQMNRSSDWKLIKSEDANITTVIQNISGLTPAKGAQLLRRCTESLASVGKVLKELESATASLSEADKEILYFANLAVAALHRMHANLTMVESKGSKGEFYQSAVDDALAIYMKMERQPEYANDAFVQFRICTCLDMKGTRYIDAAALKMSEAYALLANDARIRSDSTLQTIIPRLYGYYSWAQARHIWHQWHSAGQRQIGDRQRIEFLKNAVDATIASLERLGNISCDERYRSHARATSLNNLASYVWELHDIGTSTDNQEKLRRAEISVDDILQCVCSESWGEENEVNKIDTLMKTYSIAGNASEANKLADQLATLIDQRGDIPSANVENYTFMRYSIERIKAERSKL